METPFCEIYIADNTTVQLAGPAGTVLAPVAYTAGPSTHGELSGVATLTAAVAKITCVPGIYNVLVEASIEGPATSDANTSGDTTGKITLAVGVGGTLVTGSKSQTQDVTDGNTSFVAVNKKVEITRAQAIAGTNYIQPFVLGSDASGNDVLARQVRFCVTRLS